MGYLRWHIKIKTFAGKLRYCVYKCLDKQMSTKAFSFSERVWEILYIKTCNINKIDSKLLQKYIMLRKQKIQFRWATWEHLSKKKSSLLSRSFTHQIHPSKASDSQTDEIGQIRNSYRRQNAGQFVLTRMLPDGVRTQKTPYVIAWLVNFVSIQIEFQIPSCISIMSELKY